MNSRSGDAGKSRQGKPRYHIVRSTPAFATYVDAYAFDEPDGVNAALVAAIRDWRSADAGIKSSNQLGWHSARTLFERTEPQFHELFAFIAHGLHVSVRRHWPEFDPRSHVAQREGWVNVNAKGAFNAIHEHDGFHYSGVYYVASPGSPASDETSAARSGAVEFLNPVGLNAARLPNGAHLLPSKLTIQPRPGTMLIFPSHLRHWVYPNQDEEERVSIAFNVRLGQQSIQRS